MNDAVCIGSSAVDSVSLIDDFPSPDEISLAHWSKQFCGGSSANVSVGLSRLGVYTGLISKVGRDQEGILLLNRLISEGVDIRGVNISGKTSRTVVLINKRGEKAIIADTECVLKTGEELPVECILEAKALYIGDWFASVARRAVDLARKIDARSFLRVKNVHLSLGSDLEDIVRDADFTIMNEKTYSAIDVRDGNFIITKGKRGSYYVKEDITSRGFSVESVDTTGAGDAFCAGFIYKIMKGGSVGEALQFGNAAGAVSTTRYGAMDSMPSKKEIESLMLLT